MANSYFHDLKKQMVIDEYTTMKNAEVKTTRQQRLEILSVKYDLTPKTLIQLMSNSKYIKKNPKKFKINPTNT